MKGDGKGLDGPVKKVIPGDQDRHRYDASIREFLMHSLQLGLTIILTGLRRPVSQTDFH
jgi:hypothetical protein